MTTQQALEREQRALDRAVASKSLYAILTAGRGKAAARWEKGGDGATVEPHREEQQFRSKDSDMSGDIKTHWRGE